MALAESTMDDPTTLRRIMSAAKPYQSHVGRMMDASQAHAHLFTNTESKSQSVAKKERDRQLKLQREYQAAWEVAANRSLQLPALRTMAPSFTKTADEGCTDMGGTVIGGAGYNTIVAMVPTVDTVRRIADSDELISSFRPYRIDALRAARQAAAAEDSAPHPDDERHLEPTLRTLAAGHLMDVRAIPDDVVQENWATASAFAAASVLAEGEAPLPAHSVSPAEALLPTRVGSPRRAPPKGTSSFLTTRRFKSPSRIPGVRQPDIGHYHQRYTQVEPRVVGGYMSPRESAAPQTRPHHEDVSEPVESLAETQAPMTAATLTVAEGTKTLMASTLAYREQHAATLGASRTRTRLPPVVRGSHMFVSKTQRSKSAFCSPAKDLDYYPYADVRSTVRRPRCPVKFDVHLNGRRHECVTTSATVGMYDLATDISIYPHRVVCMDRDTGRAGHWRNKPPAYQSAPEFVDVEEALKLVRPRTRVVTMAPQVPEAEQEERQKAPDTTVSIERDLNFPRSIFDHCEGKRVRQFATMVGRSASAPLQVHEAPETVEFTQVTPRTPCAIIHPTAPGHAPLHRPNPTEIGDVPNLRWVKPRTERTMDFGVVATASPSQLPTRDLWYDTSKRALVEPRVTGNPMIETQVSREKRAKIFSRAGCGAHAVYNIDLPQKGKSVPVFEKQITKETQFCGHRLQSERWLRKYPRAPGPGHYNVSYRLVE
ncbi:uncharacterized protein Tco025E_07200 [Trypanosoma conorhini]|uniref:Uncharacterized protein n=1 Tax=Trypanosoma conorhini TaxID=83891 RepID=A0A3R7MM62_9TRYP|nr:uncharacterized protein Tco025E_07200 [Trypanosoma conorhini]RNF08351.1 hypothetical protein Tco025E_07200 [Trypanosoma conorhini]